MTSQPASSSGTTFNPRRAGLMAMAIGVISFLVGSIGHELQKNSLDLKKIDDWNINRPAGYYDPSMSWSVLMILGVALLAVGLISWFAAAPSRSAAPLNQAQ